METTVNMHKPEAHWLRPNERHFSYTFGGAERYRAEIAALAQCGYQVTQHDVTDREERPLTVVVLHLGDEIVKVYEL